MASNFSEITLSIAFKIMKSTLEVKPIFHWTESRIKGRFVICFLAFLLESNIFKWIKNINS